jgi:hypothetical protein
MAGRILLGADTAPAFAAGLEPGSAPRVGLPAGRSGRAWNACRSLVRRRAWAVGPVYDAPMAFLCAVVLPLVMACCTACAGAVTPASAPDQSRDAEKNLLVLRNSRVVVGISPRLAGRVVVLRTPQGANVLSANPPFWAPDAKLPELKGSWDYPAVNGHVIWNGPQRDWWLFQDVAAEWKANKWNWPPDPWTEFAPYEVVKKSKTSVVLRGPASPVTGLGMTKEVALEKDGTVRFRVTAENTRTAPIAWDLWSNMRLVPAGRLFVPLSNGSLKIEHGSSNPWKQAVLGYDVVDGWFRFQSGRRIPEGKECRVAKAFITPTSGLMVAFFPAEALVRRFTAAPRAEVHPDQGVVEAYQMVHRDPALCLLEAEYHGPLRTLKPGEKMAMEETWTILPAPADEASFLKGL